MPTTKVQCGFFAGQFDDLFKRGTEDGSAALRRMGIGADEMNESLFDQRASKLLNLRSEYARQASCRYLQEAAAFDQRPQNAGLLKDAAIALGVRQDSHQPGRRQLGEEPVQGEVDVVGQLEQNMTAAIAQRDNLAGLDLSHEIGIDSHVGARQHSQGQVTLLQKSLELGGRRADGFARVLRKVSQLMGCGDDRSDPVSHGHLGHGNRLISTGRAVIEIGQ